VVNILLDWPWMKWFVKLLRLIVEIHWLVRRQLVV